MKKLFLLIGMMAFITPAFALKYDPQLNKKPNPVDVMPFAITLSHIKQFYVKTPKDKKIFEDAIRGMLAGLDPHSTYLDEKDLKALTAQTNGNFVGVGMVVAKDKKALKVVSPIIDSPAEKAGIKAGDYIIAINKKPTTGLTVDKAVELIRGKVGTKVLLTVANEKDKKVRNITITRKRIKLKNIRKRILSDGFLYIRVAQFQKNTGKQVKAAYLSLLKELHGKKPKGLVLDLRNNPGGLLNEAVTVSDLFLDANKLKGSKTIVYTKERDDKVGIRLKAKTRDLTQGIPIVVLINSGSASASEIVAGALQDYKRGVVIGTRSFGKGSVQTLLPLDNKTAIKLTTALYYTPKGRSIQETGITPDIMVEQLTFKKKKKEDDALAFLTRIREKDLKGHFENKKSKIAVSKAKDKKFENDYQIREATHILQAIRLTNQRQDA